MLNDTVAECRDLIDKAFGLIAQAARDLKDARGLVAIMEAELAKAKYPNLKRLDTAEVIALRDAIEWDKGEVYILVGAENSEGGDRRAEPE